MGKNILIEEADNLLRLISEEELEEIEDSAEEFDGFTGIRAVGRTDNLAMPKIAEVKQRVKEHFDSENKILDNVKDEMSNKEYEYRKAEIKRQAFYIMLILSNFSA